MSYHLTQVSFCQEMENDSIMYCQTECTKDYAQKHIQLIEKKSKLHEPTQ